MIYGHRLISVCGILHIGLRFRLQKRACQDCNRQLQKIYSPDNRRQLKPIYTADIEPSTLHPNLCANRNRSNRGQRANFASLAGGPGVFSLSSQSGSFRVSGAIDVYAGRWFSSVSALRFGMSYDFATTPYVNAQIGSLHLGLWGIITLIQGIMMLTMSQEEFEHKYVLSPSKFPIF